MVWMITGLYWEFVRGICCVSKQDLKLGGPTSTQSLSCRGVNLRIFCYPFNRFSMRSVKRLIALLKVKKRSYTSNQNVHDATYSPD